MIHYLNLGGQDRPLTLTYSVAYDYQVEFGRYYNTDVTELCVQILRAGDSLNKAKAELSADLEKSQIDKMMDLIRAANGSEGFDMIKFVDILFVALVVGHRKTSTPVKFTQRDVADWIGESAEAIAEFTSLLLQANFNLKASGEAAEPDESASGKKKTPAQSTGTNY